MTDTIIMVYSASPANNTPPASVHIKFSTDYGATWTDEDKFTNGNPVTGFPLSDLGQGLVVCAPNGNLIVLAWSDVAGVGNGTYQSVSTDGGASWSAPSQITISGLSGADNLLTFATNQAVIVGSVIYVAAVHYSYLNWQTNPESYYMSLIKSTDNGSTWAHVSQIGGASATGYGEGSITRTGTNTLFATLRDLSDNIYTTYSTNLGLTWSSPALCGIADGGRNMIYTRSQLHGDANWWLDPVLLMTGFVNTTPMDARQNSLWVSVNRGETWSDAFALDTPADGRDGGYGDMFWDATNSQYVAVNYRGLPAAADVKQYNLTIGGI